MAVNAVQQFGRQVIEFTNNYDVVLNPTLAQRLYPGENPVGKRIAWAGDGAIRVMRKWNATRPRGISTSTVR